MKRHVTERVSVARDFRNPGQKKYSPSRKRPSVTANVIVISKTNNTLASIKHRFTRQRHQTSDHKRFSQKKAAARPSDQTNVN